MPDVDTHYKRNKLGIKVMFDIQLNYKQECSLTKASLTSTRSCGPDLTYMLSDRSRLSNRADRSKCLNRSSVFFRALFGEMNLYHM